MEIYSHMAGMVEFLKHKKRAPHGKVIHFMGASATWWYVRPVAPPPSICMSFFKYWWLDLTLDIALELFRQQSSIVCIVKSHIWMWDV